MPRLLILSPNNRIWSAMLRASRPLLRLVGSLAVLASLAVSVQTYASTTVTNYHNFDRSYPTLPNTQLTEANDGNFYGVTMAGGAYENGCIYQQTPAGVVTVIYSFGPYNSTTEANSDGYEPNTKLTLGSDGNLYGTTRSGGVDGLGTVFKATTAGVLTNLISFTGATGSYPGSDPSLLIQGSDGNLYGATAASGPNGSGTVFELSTSGNSFANLVGFTGTTGSFPGSSPNTLIEGSDGNLYGTTELGGAGNYGTVYKVSRTGTSFASLVSFTDNTGTDVGDEPTTLLQGSDGNLYGTTLEGDEVLDGTVFKVSTSGAFTNLVSFGGSNGSYPSTLLQGTDGNLYGTTESGGSGGPAAWYGTVFKVSTSGAFTSLVSFTNTSGAYPGGTPTTLLQGADGNLYGSTQSGGSDGYGAVYEVSTTGSFNSLVSFTGSEDPYPGSNVTSLLQGSDGYLYGATLSGGPSVKGTTFKLSTAGTVEAISSFGPADGLGQAIYALIRGADGNLYGASEVGGAFSYGMIFKLTPSGQYSIIVSFTGDGGPNPGYYPNNLLQGSDGNLYGTCVYGGVDNDGTVFKASTSGAFTNLVSFTGNTGSLPGSLPLLLLQGADGNLYGATATGGSGGYGTVFEVSTLGAFDSLASFTDTTGPDLGDEPIAMLQGSDGNLYGITYLGGSAGDGTVFEVSTSGAFSSLINFTGTGSFPGTEPAGLTQGSDGNLYGTTHTGGANGFGTVFQSSTSGAFAELVDFSGSSGAYPGSSPASLLQAGNGNLFGVTSGGGATGAGEVYTVSTSGASFASLASLAKTPYVAPTPIVLGSDGNLYDTTFAGGANGTGSIFTVHPADGSDMDLYDFSATTDAGESPLLNAVGSGTNVPLVQIGGTFYGTTYGGGSEGNGTLYSVAFTPDVTTQPTATQINTTQWTLSCFGTDSVSPTITYSWSVVSSPSGAPAPTFSPNTTAAAANTTVTFGAAGNYAFQCVITNGLGGATTTQTVAVGVSQVAANVTVTPPTASVDQFQTQQFNASATDQFGAAVTGLTNASFSWGVNAGGAGGSINDSGLYSAPTSTVGADTVTAAYGGQAGSATVTVVPLVTVKSLTLTPGSVAGGAASTATVTLSGAAPADGEVVQIASSNASIASVPSPSITIAGGHKTATFSVTSLPVAVLTKVTIQAALGITVSATLKINPPVISSIALNPTSLTGGSSSTATITISSAAPAGGIKVKISSLDAAVATVPSASVTVPAGSTSVTFTVKSKPVASTSTATIQATLGGSVTAILTVNPPAIKSLTLSPTSVVGGNSAIGTVKLNADTAVATLVALSSSLAGVTVPPTVTVAAGATSATFTVGTSTVTAKASATIDAAGNGTASAVLTVKP
jgi:uncharacterized repeat protein (TIGR03803 family)